MRELDKAAIGHHLPDEACQNLVRLGDGGGGGGGGGRMRLWDSGKAQGVRLFSS